MIAAFAPRVRADRDADRHGPCAYLQGPAAVPRRARPPTSPLFGTCCCCSAAPRPDQPWLAARIRRRPQPPCLIVLEAPSRPHRPATSPTARFSPLPAPADHRLTAGPPAEPGASAHRTPASPPAAAPAASASRLPTSPTLAQPQHYLCADPTSHSVRLPPLAAARRNGKDCSAARPGLPHLGQRLRRLPPDKAPTPAARCAARHSRAPRSFRSTLCSSPTAAGVRRAVSESSH